VENLGASTSSKEGENSELDIKKLPRVILKLGQPVVKVEQSLSGSDSES